MPEITNNLFKKLSDLNLLDCINSENFFDIESIQEFKNIK